MKCKKCKKRETIAIIVPFPIPNFKRKIGKVYNDFCAKCFKLSLKSLNQGG